MVPPKDPPPYITRHPNLAVPQCVLSFQNPQATPIVPVCNNHSQLPFYCKTSENCLTRNSSDLSSFVMSIPIYVALGAISIFFFKYLLTCIQNYRFSKAHGCQEARKRPQFEQFIGYDTFKRTLAMTKARTLLPDTRQRFDDIGDTWSMVTLGRKLWLTREPENVKAVLATNFKDFGIGRRYLSLGRLLGQGIFTSDGTLWEHSRVRAFLIRRRIRCSLYTGPSPSQLY